MSCCIVQLDWFSNMGFQHRCWTSITFAIDKSIQIDRTIKKNAQRRRKRPANTKANVQHSVTGPPVAPARLPVQAGPPKLPWEVLPVALPDDGHEPSVCGQPTGGGAGQGRIGLCRLEPMDKCGFAQGMCVGHLDHGKYGGFEVYLNVLVKRRWHVEFEQNPGNRAGK
eukprot:gene25758-biopygen7514